MDKPALYSGKGVMMFKIPNNRKGEKKEEIYRLAYERWVATGRPVAVLTIGPYWGYCDLDILPHSEYHCIDFICR